MCSSDLPSTSSLFLLFLYFRNLLLKIFSELDETLRGLFLRQDEARDRRGALEATDDGIDESVLLLNYANSTLDTLKGKYGIG